jgi:hypothetical protein
LLLSPSRGEGALAMFGEFRDPKATRQVFQLQSSPDLREWKTEAITLNTPFRFEELNSRNSRSRFYRMLLSPWTETNDWANQLTAAGDALFRQADCESRAPLIWVKFIVDLNEPDRVYFQDSSKYLLHYDFAVRRLPRFQGMTPEQFNQVALRRQGQQIILGAVISPYLSSEYGFQFVGLEPYPVEFVSRLYKLVRSRAIAAPNARVFYMPAFEQADVTRQNEAFFRAQGIEVSSVDRWNAGTMVVYSPGWALGRVKFVPAQEITAAYADGRLQPNDILLTDGIPAEVPYVAAIISLAPATPNSHVAILAQSFGVPFVYLAEAAEQARVRSLVDHEVMLRAETQSIGKQVRIVDLEGYLDPALKNEILMLKATPPLEITPKASLGMISAPAQTLVPADTRYFGGKAANFGLLRRAIPANSPEAIAFSFDLWDAFLNQTLPEGQTLREAIQARLSRHIYPPNIASLRADLAAVKDLITIKARFSPEQRTAIINALKSFDKDRNIRFRSSTNVEDTQRFTGAGLYDSYSGCLADDLDDDSAGPSRCDPGEDNERGVFRAIQKAYASFYNENAFLERLRRAVKESEVGMAILVHHSTPDDLELANGVATLTVSRFGQNFSTSGQMVTQVGAVSVANPDGSARPEVVQFFQSSFATNLTFSEASSLVPLGTQVMQWPEDYAKIADLLFKVAVAYAQFEPIRSDFKLDFEYKRKAPDGSLELKQVREIPAAVTNQSPTFLLREPLDFYVYGDPFAVHRLKSRWKLTSRNLAVGSKKLSFYADARLEFGEGGLLQKYEGPPSSWPNASFATTNTLNGANIRVLDMWSVGAGENSRTYTLATEMPAIASENQSPLLTLQDADLEFQVAYASAVPWPVYDGSTMLLTNESVRLFQVDWSAATNRTFIDILTTNPVKIITSQQLLNVYPEPATPRPDCILVGPKDSYAAVGLSGETTIEGLLSQTLTLHGDFSQTFMHTGRRGHQSVYDLICDPWMEPNLSPQIKDELTAANIRLLYYRRYTFGDTTEDISILGLDGIFRPLKKR